MRKIRWDFKETENNRAIISRVVARANAIMIEREKEPFESIGLSMDLYCVDHHTPMDFQQLENHFLPRFTK